MPTRSLRAVVTALTAAALLTTTVQGPAANAVAEDRTATDCPRELRCRSEPAGEGHFAPAERGRGGPAIRYIVIHSTELTHRETIDRFQDPKIATSAHYLLRSKDGAITQLVRNSDIAYHAGNYWFNMHSIGIEHEGFIAEGPRWFTEDMYRASAALVRVLAERYDIPLDRDHIIGHDEIAPPTPDSVTGMHIDPGPYWDWAHYFDLLGAPLTDPRPAGPKSAIPRPDVVLVAPRYEENRIQLYDCKTESCTEPQVHGTNAIYLHTEPRAGSPLIGDPVLHPEGQPGTPTIQDWSARAVTGQRFAVAGRLDGWTAIWFVGRLAWFHDPDNRRGVASSGTLVTPARPDIAVYGAAYPEASAYPDDVEPTSLVPLPYRLPLGQFYVTAGEHVGDDFAAPGTASERRTHIVGQRRFIEILFSSRRAFVDAADVLTLN